MAEPHRSAIPRHKIAVFLACVVIFALGQFHRASGAVFTPILTEQFALPAIVIAGLISSMYLATLVTQVPFGAALDRFGPRLLIGLCMGCVALGTLVFSIVDGYWSAVFARVLIGIGSAAMGAATHVIIARNFEARYFGYVGGLVVGVGGIGGMLGTYPLAVALEHVSWGVVFGGVGFCTVLLTIWLMTVIRSENNGEAVEQETESTQGYFWLLQQGEFLRVLALAAVTFGPITTITGIWGGPYLQTVQGLSPEEAGAVLLVWFGATIIGALSFARIDRGDWPRKRVILTAVSISIICYGILAVVPQAPVAVAGIVLFAMIFAQQFYVALAAHMRRVVPDRMLGRASTLMSLVAVAAIPVMQTGFGAVLDLAKGAGFAPSDGYRFAFGAMAVLMAGAALVYGPTKAANDL